MEIYYVRGGSGKEKISLKADFKIFNINTKHTTACIIIYWDRQIKIKHKNKQ